MIGFAKIAGGAPSSVRAMVDHLMNQTLSEDQARLAAYYSTGVVHDEGIELAHQVADGRLLFSEALDSLLSDYVRDGGDLELLHETEERLTTRLSHLAFRIQEGLGTAPLAFLRPDMHPSAALGLGIGPAELLGKDEINALLAGRRADGALIKGKHYAVERRLPVSPKDGEVRYSTPIGSYDFCPTPDKSVSVAWAFADPAEQAKLYNAHLEAAREAVGYIASVIGQAGIGKQGREAKEPGHVTWLEFTHHTARRTQFGIDDKGEVSLRQDKGAPGDPDLHTHFLIPNAVFCDSGRVGSLDTAAIGGFIFEADAYYQAVLAQNLRASGFVVELDPQTGAARLPVIPDDVRMAFSKRTMAGELLARKATTERGEVWEDLSDAQRAARMKEATQDRDQKVKGAKDDVANVADWQRQAAAIGWKVPATFQLYGPPAPELTHEQRIRLAYKVALPFLAEQLEHKAVVPHWEARVAAARGLVHAGISELADLNAVTALMRSEGVLMYGQRTALVWGVEDGQRYTSISTALHEADEGEFIRLAKSASADRVGAIPADLLRRTIAESGLNFTGQHGTAQLAAIERLGEGQRFSLVIGSAGSGKTSLLKPLVAAWREQQRDVWGASLAWRQADDLVDAGISPRNVRAFSVLIDGLRDGSTRLTSRSVVVIDEWGLLGTRQGLELLRLRARDGFQIVALGDDKQCASIQAGAIIDLSRRALGAENVPMILTTVRQKTAREREIAGLFREGRAAEALSMKRADGTAEMVWGGYAEVVARAAKLYSERLTTTGVAPTVIAPTNLDATRIGEAVRTERRGMGLLGPDLATVQATDGERDYRLALAKGDRVRLMRSTGATFSDGRGGSIGRNGSVLDVIALDQEGITLRAKSGKIGTVRWDDLTSKKTGRVQLGYGDVMTIDKSQGMTSKHENILVFPAGTQAVDGLKGYTGNTRAPGASYLLTSEAAERAGVRKRRPLNDAREISTEDKWANAARNLSYQPEKDTATAMVERIGMIRRGAVQAFPNAVPQVGRQLSRTEPIRGQEIAETRKHERAMEQGAWRAMMHDIRQRIRHLLRGDERQTQKHRMRRGHSLGM